MNQEETQLSIQMRDVDRLMLQSPLSMRHIPVHGRPMTRDVSRKKNCVLDKKEPFRHHRPLLTQPPTAETQFLDHRLPVQAILQRTVKGVPRMNCTNRKNDNSQVHIVKTRQQNQADVINRRLTVVDRNLPVLCLTSSRGQTHQLRQKKESQIRKRHHQTTARIRLLCLLLAATYQSQIYLQGETTRQNLEGNVGMMPIVVDPKEKPMTVVLLLPIVVHLGHLCTSRRRIHNSHCRKQNQTQICPIEKSPRGNQTRMGIVLAVGRNGLFGSVGSDGVGLDVCPNQALPNTTHCIILC